MDSSKLKTYCIGVVAITKPTGTDKVMIYPAEKLTLEDGNVNEINENMEVSFVDISGVKYKSKVNRTAMIEARWFSDGSDGRQTPPDVVNGETVRVYRYADSDTFYWKTIFREPSLRRLEHVVHAYSNLKGGRAPFDLDSSYGNIFSTLDKKINIWTSQSNGESFKYDFLIDTKGNHIRLQDNVGNEFGINSTEDETYIKNSKDSYLNLYGLFMNGFAETQVCLKSKEIRLNAPSVIIGGGGNCGTTPLALADWHSKTFLYANNEEGFAAIGNKTNAYSEYKGDDIKVEAKGEMVTKVASKTTFDTPVLEATNTIETKVLKIDGVDAKDLFVTKAESNSSSNSNQQQLSSMQAQIKELQDKLKALAP